MGSRVERESSKTAAMMCFIRAGSFYENEPCLKTNDHIAPRLLPKVMLPFARIKPLRRFLWKQFNISGAIEYVIARTIFIDSVVADALKAGFGQVVVLGAGFDSRALRFQRPDSNAVFFELDAPTTQSEKVRRLRRRGISVPENTVYAPIDFNKEDFATVLQKHGYDTSKKTLFILEGITMYLEEDSVRSTLKTLGSLSAPHGLVVSDFIHKSVLRGDNTLREEQLLRERVANLGEPWRFGIEQHQVGAFLDGLGLRLLKSCTARDLERELDFGSHRINGAHLIVLAEIP
jgi:methyltransferase (TIGR00027 family)